MTWTSTSSADTTWQAVTPGTSVSNTLLTQIQAEAAAADASATAAASSATAAASSATAAASSATDAATSATAASDSATDASTFATQAQNAAASLTPIPAGGSTGQSLVKNSATDYDYAWATVAGGGGSLAFQDEGSLVLASPSNVNFVGAGVTVTDVSGVATVTIPGGGAVTSVFSRTGAVTAQSGDYTFAQIGSKPTTLAGYGITDAAALSHTHAAADITSGTVATARLGSGTPSASTFLRGDQSWASVTFANLTSTPTTLAGYGITDAAASSHTHATTDITSGTFADARIAASNVTQHQASLALAGSQITSGTVDPARLGSGTAITTKFLRGDSTWQTIAGGGDALTTNPLSQFAATTSAQLAGVISDETGSGALVFATSPTLVTPTLGVATATSVNKVAITAPATGATLTIADGATLTASATATVSGTNTGDQTSVSGNAGTATALQTARTINGVSFDGTANITVTAAAGTLTGSTLASGVTASSLTSVGTLTSLTMGGQISMADNVVERPYFKDFAETRSTPSISAGALTVDYSAGNVAVVTMNANVTSLTLSNPPATGRIGELTLILKQDATGSRTVTWPAAVKWPGGTAPTLSGANKTDIITLITDDAGTTWWGASALNY